MVGVQLLVQPASPDPSGGSGDSFSTAPPSPLVRGFSAPSLPTKTSLAAGSGDASTSSFNSTSSNGLGLGLGQSQEEPQMGGLAARRKMNKKKLSLLVPGSSANAAASTSSSASLSVNTPSLPQPPHTSTGTSFSITPLSATAATFPVPLSAYVVEGQEDRSIGRLMMKSVAEEMAAARGREELGGRLRGRWGMERRGSLTGMSAGASAVGGGSSSGDAVRLLGRRKETDGDADADEEEFPYANGPREIFPGVFLGSEQNAADERVLSAWGIKKVLNVAKEVRCPWVVEEEARTSYGPRAGSSKVAVGGAGRVSLGVGSSGGARVRPTASTPNLQREFKGQAALASPATGLAIDTTTAGSGRREEKADGSTKRSLSTSPNPDGLEKVVSGRIGAGAASVNGGPRETYYDRPRVTYLHLPWGHDESDLIESGKFATAFDFIDTARERGENVLVHCQCGVSRSATVVIGWAMREAAEGRLDGVSGMHEAYSFVKGKSEWVGPNLGLVFQLVAYERTLGGGAAAVADDDDDEEPYPFPASPRTPNSVGEGDVSSASSAEVLTPDHLPINPSMENGSERKGEKERPRLAIFTGAEAGASVGRGIVLHHDDSEEEILSPAFESALSFSPTSPAASYALPSLTSMSTSLASPLPQPPRISRPSPNTPLALKTDLSPFPENVTAPPPAPFIESER
ncbi:tyrosine-protein phosphatase [Pseudohyphozyma bogoriensis]|nr:tyrosine-protein phosphatase [Pseudohyphozyma bogoriensis]